MHDTRAPAIRVTIRSEMGTRLVVITALLLGTPAVALACPFCGGKGASGLLENLLLVAGLWFGARSLMRWLQIGRKRLAATREQLQLNGLEPADRHDR
jgi:hypothetical protein